MSDFVQWPDHLAYIPLRQNVNDLLSKNERGIVHDTRMLYVALVDGDFTVVEDFHNGSQNATNGYLYQCQLDGDS